MAYTRTPSQLIRLRLPVILVPRSHRRIRRYRSTQEKRRRPSLERLLTRLCHYSRPQRACRLTVSTALLPVLPQERKKISAALRSSSAASPPCVAAAHSHARSLTADAGDPTQLLPHPPRSPPIPPVFARGAGVWPGPQRSLLWPVMYPFVYLFVRLYVLPSIRCLFCSLVLGSSVRLSVRLPIVFSFIRHSAFVRLFIRLFVSPSVCCPPVRLYVCLSPAIHRWFDSRRPAASRRRAGLAGSSDRLSGTRPPSMDRRHFRIHAADAPAGRPPAQCVTHSARNTHTAHTERTRSAHRKPMVGTCHQYDLLGCRATRTRCSSLISRHPRPYSGPRVTKCGSRSRVCSLVCV